MNRINNRGMELLQYKTELLKDYPKLVKDSLVLALEQMKQNDVLDYDTYMNITDETFSKETLEEYLLTKVNFLKSDEEMFHEFEVLRNILNEKLEEIACEGVLSESLIDKDIILVTKKFCINEQFTMDYFQVEEKDLLRLMKRRGFIEKFAVLRLTAIFKDFIKQLSPEDIKQCDTSLVYFDKDENGYSIDLCFEIKIEDIENPEFLGSRCENIKRIKEQAEEFYQNKMIC